MSTLPTVSVIMATFRRASELPAAVLSLLADPAASEVVVAVDGCLDGSIEVLEKLAADDPRLKPLWIEHAGKQGAAAAALAAASGDVVLLMDDDMIAAPGLAAGHARHHAAREDLVVLGYSPTSVPARRARGNIPVFLYARDYDNHCDELEADDGLVLRELHGCNVSLRRADCERIGLYAPEFPNAYHEDQEFGLRCLRAGMVGVFDRSLRAEHRYTRSVEGFLRDARSQGAGSVMVHLLHSELTGPFDPRCIERGLALPLALVVRSARLPWVARTVGGALRPVIWLAGWLRAFGLESGAIRLARRVEQRYGAELATRRRFSVRAGAPPA